MAYEGIDVSRTSVYKRGQLGKYEVCIHGALLLSIHEEIKRIFQELVLGAEVEREGEGARESTF